MGYVMNTTLNSSPEIPERCVTASLYLGPVCKMPLVWGAAEGSLAVRPLMGIPLSPGMDTQGLMLHGRTSGCRHHSSPFAPSPLLSFCFRLSSFRLRRSWVRNVCFGKRRKKTTLELVKKKCSAGFNKEPLSRKLKSSIEVSFFSFLFFLQNKVDGNSWRL